MSEEGVLVSGGSGFIAVHCIDQLLRKGFRVRTTVRSLAREADVRAMLREAGHPPENALSFVQADLMSDEGWDRAVKGCSYVLHVASPFPTAIPKDEDELIAPAREGTLRVLRAARDEGIARVVMTSSLAAVGEGHPAQLEPFNETSWTDLDGKDVTAYAKSKTLAELAAWDFIQQEGNGLELAVVNPVSVFGPVFGPNFSTSIVLVQRLMDGAVPACPRMSLAIVDVRDVADLHLRAMLRPEAKGERFLAVAGASTSMIDVATVLRRHLGSPARRVPTRQMPNWVVRLLAIVKPEMRLIIPLLGKTQNVTSDKATLALGWNPRSNEEAITSTAKSLLRLGLLREKPRVTA